MVARELPTADIGVAQVRLDSAGVISIRTPSVTTKPEGRSNSRLLVGFDGAIFDRQPLDGELDWEFVRRVFRATHLVRSRGVGGTRLGRGGKAAMFDASVETLEIFGMRPGAVLEIYLLNEERRVPIAHECVVVPSGHGVLEVALELEPD